VTRTSLRSLELLIPPLRLLAYLTFPELQVLKISGSRHASALLSPSALQSFLMRSACPLRRLEVDDCDAGLTQVLDAIPSLLELRLYPESVEGVTELIFSHLSVNLTCLPHLKHLELWDVRPKFLVDHGETLLSMLEARWRSVDSVECLQSVHILFRSSPQSIPDSGLLERFRLLAGEGMEFYFEDDANAQVRKLSWL